MFNYLPVSTRWFDITWLSKCISCLSLLFPRRIQFHSHHVLRFQFCVIWCSFRFSWNYEIQVGENFFYVFHSLLPHSINPATPVAHRVRCISMARLVNVSWEWWMTSTGLCVNKNTDGEFRWFSCKDQNPPLLRLDPNLGVSRTNKEVCIHKATCSDLRSHSAMSRRSD